MIQRRGDQERAHPDRDELRPRADRNVRHVERNEHNHRMVQQIKRHRRFTQVLQLPIGEIEKANAQRQEQYHKRPAVETQDQIDYDRDTHAGQLADFIQIGNLPDIVKREQSPRDHRQTGFQRNH